MFKLAIATALAASAAADPAAELREMWSDYKAKFNKSYSADDEPQRFRNFQDSLHTIARRTAMSGSKVHGLTKFSDMSQQEFEKTMLNYRPAGTPRGATVQQPLGDAPSSYDWRDHGAVTDVKDQGMCGSCWAFSATEQVESAWFLAGNDLTEFSPQQTVSCDTTDAGCNGGDTITAYEYINSAGGLETEADYPYTSGKFGITGSCEFEASKVAGGNIEADAVYMTDPCTGFKCDSQDEDKLQANMGTVAPASICVDASSWNSYTGGVMTSKDCKSGYYDLDHCVQAVGYTTGDPDFGDYWIVRNSWADDWGEGGFIYLEMGSNTCGIADEATTVTIKA